MANKLFAPKCFILVFLCNIYACIECCFSAENAKIQISLHYMILIVLLYFCNPTPAFIRMNAMGVSPGRGFADPSLQRPNVAFAEREGSDDKRIWLPPFFLL